MKTKDEPAKQRVRCRHYVDGPSVSSSLARLPLLISFRSTPGFCHRGSSCTFLHELPGSVRPVPMAAVGLDGQDVDDELSCGVCYNVPEVFGLLSCSHVFCHTCLMEWRADKSAEPAERNGKSCGLASFSVIRRRVAHSSFVLIYRSDVQRELYLRRSKLALRSQRSREGTAHREVSPAIAYHPLPVSFNSPLTMTMMSLTLIFFQHLATSRSLVRTTHSAPTETLAVGPAVILD